MRIEVLDEKLLLRVHIMQENMVESDISVTLNPVNVLSQNCRDLRTTNCIS